jgi:hypothetical protein
MKLAFVFVCFPLFGPNNESEKQEARDAHIITHFIVASYPQGFQKDKDAFS